MSKHQVINSSRSQLYGFGEIKVDGMTFGHESHLRILNEMLPYYCAYVNSIGFDNIGDPRLVALLSDLSLKIHALTLPYEESETFVDQFRGSKEKGDDGAPVYGSCFVGTSKDTETGIIEQEEFLIVTTCELDSEITTVSTETGDKKSLDVFSLAFLGYTDIDPLPFFQKLEEGCLLKLNPKGHYVGVLKDRKTGVIHIKVMLMTQFLSHITIAC